MMLSLLFHLFAIVLDCVLRIAGNQEKEVCILLKCRNILSLLRRIWYRIGNSLIAGTICNSKKKHDSKMKIFSKGSV